MEALNRVSDGGETLESGEKTELLETLNEGSEGNQIILRRAVQNHPFPALPDRYCPGSFVSGIHLAGPGGFSEQEWSTIAEFALQSQQRLACGTRRISNGVTRLQELSKVAGGDPGRMQTQKGRKAQQCVETVPLPRRDALTADNEPGCAEIYQNSVRRQMPLRSGLYVSHGDFVGRGGNDRDLVTRNPIMF